MTSSTTIAGQQREFFEGIWTDRNLDGLLQEFTRLRLERAGVRPAGRVLDVGAGAGRVSALAGDAFVTSIDLTLASCAALAARGSAAVQGDASTLPFPDDCFDVVAILDVIEHVEDPVVTMRELRRVLRPGGTLVLTCPNNEVPIGVGVLFSLYIREWPTCDNLEKWDPEHLRRPSVAEMRELAEAAGFEVRRLSTWARSAFSLTFFLLYGARRRIRGRKLARIGLHRERLDRVMVRAMRIAQAVDHALIGDGRSAIVLTATARAVDPAPAAPPISAPA